MSLEQPSTPNELSEVIAESFGANATYVEALLARFRSDPSLVDEIKTSGMIVDATKPLDRPFSPVSKCPDEAMARIKLEEYVPGEVLQHIPMDRTTYWA